MRSGTEIKGVGGGSAEKSLVLPGRRNSGAFTCVCVWVVKDTCLSSQCGDVGSGLKHAGDCGVLASVKRGLLSIEIW